MKKLTQFLPEALGVMGLAAASITVSAQNTVITGNIKGLKDKEIHVAYHQGAASKQDSIRVVHGRFTWKLQLAEPQEVYFMFPKMYFSFFAEPGHENITGISDSAETFKLTGSKTQDESVAYEKSLKDLTDQQAPLYRQYGKVSKEEQAELEKKLADINDKIHERGAAYVAAHPSSYYSIHLVASRAAYGTDYSVVKQLYDRLTEEAKATEAGKALADRLDILKRSAIGSQMINFSQADTTGATVQFSAFKGKYVLVDFWASWCGPCRAENPNVLKAYDKFKDRDFTVVGISLDDKADKWKKAIRDDKMPWTELSDLKGWKNEVADHFGIQGIPSNLLVDPSGKIVARDLRGEALEQKLNELLMGNRQAFTLVGKIDGVDTGTIYLAYGRHAGERVLDSAAIVHGQFSFEGNVQEPTMAYLYEKGDRRMEDANSTGIFIEPAAMTFEATQGQFADAQISGSASETEYQSLEAELKPIMEDRKPLDREYDSANSAYIKAMHEKKLDERSLDSMKYRTAVIHDKYDPFTERFQKVYMAFFIAHPQSYVTANELLFMTNSLGLDTAELFYDHLGPTIQQSAAGKKLVEEIAKLKAGSPGSMAADFSRKDLHGAAIKLSDYRGKYVLLDFWASWCVPCRKSMPHVKELYEKYKNKGFRVLAVSDDDSRPDAWQKAIAKDGTDLWPNVLRGYDQRIPYGVAQPDDVHGKFGIQTLPTKILIDPAGKIIGRYEKATEEESAALDAKLASLFTTINRP